jgi:hypothetical protein
MRSTRCLSSDRCSYYWSSIFPSWPELTSVTAPHLAGGVQFLGGNLRCLSAASKHTTDYRCAFVMLQHRNSLLSYGGFSTRHNRPIRAISLSVKQGSTAMTAFAFCRKQLRALARYKLMGWALRTSDRVWQDKSRKVRTVGWGRNSAKFRLVRNIARVSRNLRFSATHYRPPTFYTLRSER